MNCSVLQNISYGMYALGVVTPDGRPSACIVNACIQVTGNPALIAVSVNHDNFSCECIKANGIFSLSILSEDTAAFTIGSLGFKSGRDNDKLSKLNFHAETGGLPVIDDNICGFMTAKVVSQAETYSHTVFIAEVTDCSEKIELKPMTYSYYHTVIKGKAPEKAPHA